MDVPSHSRWLRGCAFFGFRILVFCFWFFARIDPLLSMLRRIAASFKGRMLTGLMNVKSLWQSNGDLNISLSSPLS